MGRFVTIGESGAPAGADAEKWVAVMDHSSGLMWTVEEIAVTSQKRALAAVRDLRVGGFSDWRAPTVEELFLLADRSRREPAIDTAYFPRCKSDWYWTSTPAAPGPEYAWFVGFYNGSAFWYHQSYPGFVRACRAS